MPYQSPLLDIKTTLILNKFITYLFGSIGMLHAKHHRPPNRTPLTRQQSQLSLKESTCTSAQFSLDGSLLELVFMSIQ